MKMSKLATPTRELAARILTEVGFEERLPGYRMHKRAGIQALTLYRFEEVVGLLQDPYPRMDFDRLEEWIRETMGDGELADKVRAVVERDISDRERTLWIKELMGLRLHQCKKLA